MSVSAHQGVTGTVGGGQPNIFYDWHLGDCYHNCDPYTVGGSVKPIVLSTDRTMKGVYTGGALYTSTNEDYETFVVEHSSGGQNGAGNIYFKRAGTTIGRIKSQYFDGISVYVSKSGGTPAKTWTFDDDGNLQSEGVTFANLTGNNGALVFCSNCQVTSGADNTCASGGTGALAARLNGVWRCFAAQN
jgi:hypothetical protein